jgi:hypothetical protein
VGEQRLVLVGSGLLQWLSSTVSLSVVRSRARQILTGLRVEVQHGYEWVHLHEHQQQLADLARRDEDRDLEPRHRPWH